MLEDRIFRCGTSDFYGDEIGLCNSTHTDKRLKGISDAGFNGIWLRGKLRELAPGDLFREYANQSAKRLSQLAKLCERSSGLGVWLYMTEPLGLETNHTFWKKNPDLEGPRMKIMHEPQQSALCSSTQQVRDYLYEGFNKLFTKVPLRGVILITSSEQVNNCWAHVLSSPATYPSAEKFWFRRCKCSRCRPCGPVKVITEILNLVNSSIRTANPKAKVVAWDWSWNMHCRPPYKPIIDRLDKSIILMGDFERGGKVQRSGKKVDVEEYSLCYPGPSSRFHKETQLVKKKRPMLAKLQINTTHELATVPNLPLVVSLYRKFSYLRKHKSAGFMGTWNLGCSTDTLNVFAVKSLCEKKNIGNERTWLKWLAKEYFGKDIDSKSVIKTWYAFQRVCQYYPVNGNKFVYWSCINYALAYPLKLKFDNIPMGPAWIPHKYGDKLENSLGSFTLTEVVELLRKLSSGWQNAVELYKKSLASVCNTECAKKEIVSATIAGCSFRSTYNIYRWYQLRKKKIKLTLGKTELEIIADEIENLQTALPHIGNDDRLGFHEESKWRIYDKDIIKKKVNILKHMIM